MNKLDFVLYTITIFLSGYTICQIINGKRGGECEHEPIRNEKGEILIGPDNKAVCGECEEYLIIKWEKVR